MAGISARFSNFAFVLFCYITNHLMTGPLGNSEFCFPQISMFPETKSRGNIEILGKQNSLFPSGPVIKCCLQTTSETYIVVTCTFTPTLASNVCFYNLLQIQCMYHMNIHIRTQAYLRSSTFFNKSLTNLTISYQRTKDKYF